MKKTQASQKSFGVLGGGQLALFLSSKAQELGLKLFVLSPSKKDPVALKNKNWLQGDPHQKKDLKKFLSPIDILTFESEFFPASLIKECKKKTKVHPSLKNLADIQDRLLQKKLLTKHGFPLLNFQAWENTVPLLKPSKKGAYYNNGEIFINAPNKKKSSFKTAVKYQKTRFKKRLSFQGEALLRIWNQWGPFVLKTRKGGYDGCGTFVVKDRTRFFQWLDSSTAPKSSFIVEPLLEFKRELALISARNQKDQIVFFPLVESFQENSVCLWVKGPVKHPKLAGLKRKIRSFLTKIDYRGVIAFELFDTNSGLIVNELAPRVHNTGHYSLTALTEDQFSLHLKAISNQDLKTPRLLSKEFAMLNLLGEGTVKPLFQRKGKALSLIHQSKHLRQKGFDLYWYGKKESRPGRKMGHINCVGDHSLERLLQLKKQIKV